MMFQQHSINTIPYVDLRELHRLFYEELWERKIDKKRFNYQFYINGMKEALYQHTPYLKNITYQFISTKYHTEIKINLDTKKRREKMEDGSLMTSNLNKSSSSRFFL